MIEFVLDTQVLGNTVFAFSPLAETASSLRLLTASNPSWVHQPWLTEARRRLREAEPSVAWELLTHVAPGDADCAPDFLYPPARTSRTTIEEQLQVLSSLPADQLAADMVGLWPGSRPPVPVQALLEHGPDAGKVLAEAVRGYWVTAVAPFWLRMTKLLEEDIAYRALQSLQGGLFELLAELHPKVHLVGDRLLLGTSDHSDACYGRAQLTLVPSVFTWPGFMLTHDVPGQFELTYGCRGAARVWENLDTDMGQAHPLGSLLGRNRARILRMLSVPRSTTELARELGKGMPAINHHLTVLRDCGLATSWRTGRVVLYQQTPLAISLIELNQIT